jgi:hypothetical protein
MAWKSPTSTEDKLLVSAPQVSITINLSVNARL